MEGDGGAVTPGYRFYPIEEELISFYLKHKIHGTNMSGLQENIHRVIPQLHVNDFYPWDLPKNAGELCQGDPEQWFFFIPRQEKEVQGGRPSRLTKSGYWKGTGSPSIIYSSSNQAIGIKRSMVFYNGRVPTGKKTNWKMNEYKAFQEHYSRTHPTPKLMQEMSLCRVYIKSNCLRTFDRRPSGIVIREPRTVRQALHSNECNATASNHFNYDKSITNSTSSSSGYNNNSLEESIEDLPLWDWEENHYLF